MVELLIGMSIAATLTAGMLASYTYLARNQIRDSLQQQLEAQSRRMLQMFAQDVHIAVTVDASDYTTSSSNKTNQITLTMSDGSTVQYTYARDPTTGVWQLTRAPGWTPPDKPPLLSSVSILPNAQYQGFFGCFDRQNYIAGSQQAIRTIEMANFMATAGTGSSGTQTRFGGASSRLVLRNKRPPY